MEKIPDKFIERQMVETRYVTKRIMQELQKVEGCKVWSSVGSITDYLKNDWGLNDVFKEVLLERYRRLEGITGQKLVERKNEPNGRHYWDIKDWSKRIDHRHHALDAITIALTTQSMVQRLNNLNQTNRDGVRQKSAWHFDPPHPQLKRLVQEALENIVVSHRNRKRLMTPSPGFYTARDKETGKLKQHKQEKGKTYAVRDALHDEQPYGQVKVYEKTPIKNAFVKVADLAMPWQKELVQARLAAHDGNASKALASLKKEPLLKPNGKPLEEVTVFKLKFIKNRSLSVSITENQLKEVADRGLRDELLAHLKAHGGDPKKAFTEENLGIFNEGRKKPVYSVRSLAEGSYVPMKRKNDPNNKLFVQKGNNYCFVIYEHVETGEREYDVVAFYDAVQLKSDKLDIVLPKEGFRHFTLTHNDLVYVPEPSENVKAIDWERDLKQVSKRIYKVVKFTAKGGEIHFVHHRISEPFEAEFTGKNNAPASGYKHCSPYSFDNPPLPIRETCIKLGVDRMGRVRPA